jgi:hypothetical protein
MSKYDWSNPNQRYIEEIAYSRSLEEARRQYGLPSSLPEDATLSAALAETFAGGPSLEVSVMGFSNGIVINDGVGDATSSFQRALDHVNASGGGTLNVPAGTYKVTGTITTYSNVTIRGSSHKAKIQANAPSFAVISGSGVSHSRVENLTIAGLASFGVLFSASSFVQVVNCDISGMTDSTNASGYATGIACWVCDDVILRDNYLHGNGYLTTSAAAADIQINGNGVNVGSQRIHVINNRALSTTVNVNILLYDVQQSRVSGNTAAGARIFSAGAGGYGILLYRTVNNSGLMQDNIVTENFVYSTEGTGIYLQNSLRSVISDNILVNTASVQDETSLLVGAIANNATNGTITGNVIISAGRSGIVIGNPTAAATFTIEDNSIDTVTLGSKVGIYFRGLVRNSVIAGNAITNVGIGIGTPPVDQALVNNLYSHNNIKTTTVGGGIVLYGSSRSSFIGNVIEDVAQDGIALVAVSVHNIFSGNSIFNGSTSVNNTYSGISLAGVTHNVVVGNKVGNTGGTGFKNCIFVNSTALNSLVTGNHCFGAVTANYNVDASAAANNGFYGNFDSSVAEGRRMMMRQQAILTGSAVSVTQLDLGDSSVAGALGTRTSGGDTFVAMNARHLVDGTDTWHQNASGSASKLWVLRLNGDAEFYSAAAGTADGTFATFWGTAKAAFGAGSTIKLAGTQVVTTRRTGYTNAMTNTVDRATAFDTTTVTLAQLASRVKAIQDDLTTHGLIGP